MSQSRFNNIEHPLIDRLLSSLNRISENKTSIKSTKHLFDILMRSPPFHEKFTPIHAKFEEVLNKYYSLYPEEFESYIQEYNKIKTHFNQNK